jgi:phospholipid-transporting ATPase
LLNSSDPKGVCYVETKSLDGETNLKMKNVHKKLNQHYKDKNVEENPHIDTLINCEKPNNGIYKFEGNMQL